MSPKIVVATLVVPAAIRIEDNTPVVAEVNNILPPLIATVSEDALFAAHSATWSLAAI